MTGFGEISSGGVYQHAAQGQLDRAQHRFDAAYDYAIKSGSHLWIATAAYLISERALLELETQPVNLDLENLAMAPGIGCFVCETPYSPRLRLRRCPGEPT